MNIQVTQIKVLLIACVTLISSHSFAAMQPSSKKVLMVTNNSEDCMRLKSAISLMPEYFLPQDTRHIYAADKGSTLEFSINYDNSPVYLISIPSNNTRITIKKGPDTLEVTNGISVLEKIELQ